MQKIALCMTETNEIKFLKRHLPMMAALFDNVFISDGGSTDGSKEYLKEFGEIVTLIEGDYGKGADWREMDAKNTPIIQAEKEGYDWCLNLDADEIMSYPDIDNAKKFMQGDNTFLVFPRIEFYGDTDHYKPSLYPDYQGRMFKLGIGYRWEYPIHSVIKKEGDAISAWEMGYATIVPNSQIYHYGWALDFKRRLERYYPKLLKNDLFVESWKDNPEIKRFCGKQPI